MNQDEINKAYTEAKKDVDNFLDTLQKMVNSRFRDKMLTGHPHYGDVGDMVEIARKLRQITSGEN